MNIESAIDQVYETFDGPSVLAEFHERNGTPSLCVLTVKNPSEAAVACANWVDVIRGKVVVEIGAGVGFMAMEMARHARSVFAIECDAAWSWIFTSYLYKAKPLNLTWIFGMAESVAPFIRADVAVIRTYSGLREMIAVAEQMAPKIILDFAQGWQVFNRGDPGLTKIANGVDDMVPEKILEHIRSLDA